LLHSEQDRADIPQELARLEARAAAAKAPCVRPPPDEAPAQASAPEGPPPPPPKAQPTPPTALTPVKQTRRTRGQIAAGSSLLVAGAGLGAGVAACFGARAPEADRIAALDRQASDAGR